MSATRSTRTRMDRTHLGGGCRTFAASGTFLSPCRLLARDEGGKRREAVRCGPQSERIEPKGGGDVLRAAEFVEFTSLLLGSPNGLFSCIPQLDRTGISPFVSKSLLDWSLYFCPESGVSVEAPPGERPYESQVTGWWSLSRGAGVPRGSEMLRLAGCTWRLVKRKQGDQRTATLVPVHAGRRGQN